ncbi:hypothetical protein ZHAS_00020312 [Anopheles sinensis]|uniref:Uncharacterized protein n=1 Tax=Anopheles sinensis TaxID=74873 RepID=A0A084WPR0_ANOSI|nr:hypothetical protein ZHAS_00020312 [Anopheles sinensis]
MRGRGGLNRFRPTPGTMLYGSSYNKPTTDKVLTHLVVVLLCCWDATGRVEGPKG